MEQEGNTNSSSRKRWYEEGEMSERWSNRRHPGRKKSVFGFALVLIGLFWLLRKMDVQLYPEWLLTWPVLLLALGMIHLIVNRFSGALGYIMVLIGSIFLLKNEFEIPINIAPYFWPGLLIIIGLIVIFKPGNRAYQKAWKKKRRTTESGIAHDNCGVDDNDRLDMLVVFGGVSKDIISKSFKGGEMTTVMGGTELHFTKADLDGDQATIDLTIVMGGLKVVVPRNWNVVVNATNVLGGVDDKRREIMDPAAGQQKTLVLNGFIMMGGVEINAY